MTAGHSMTGCRCDRCENKRDYMRGYRAPDRQRIIAPENTVTLIECAIARGEATSRIMRTLHVNYETVQQVRGRLDLINRVPA